MNRRIKLALFLGPVDYSICLANALAVHCDVTLFYDGKRVKNQMRDFTSMLDSKVTPRPINDFKIRDVRNLLSYHDIARELRKYHIVHVQAGNIWFGLWRKLFENIPVVYTIHDPYQHFGLHPVNAAYQRLSQKWMGIQSSALIVHGKHLKNYVVKHYGAQPEAVNVIPHGEFSFYKHHRAPKAVYGRKGALKKVLFFGEIRRNKGLEYLVKAEPIISKSYEPYQICIAGRVAERGCANVLSEIRGNDKFDIRCDFIPAGQVAHLFESSDIVVLPYVSATQSGVLALALGFGKAVVATDTGSIPEIVDHEKSGLIIPPSDEAALADALLQLLTDEGKCTRLGRHAEQTARQTLSWERIAKETHRLYEATLDR